jgi:hypothetical protein
MKPFSPWIPWRVMITWPMVNAPYKPHDHRDDLTACNHRGAMAGTARGRPRATPTFTVGNSSYWLEYNAALY